MCGNIHSESNSTYPRSHEMIFLGDIWCHKIIQTLINLHFRWLQKLLILSPSLNLTPYQALKVETALSSYPFGLKILGVTSVHTRESKFISLVLNSLHDLAVKIAPCTSQADGPCTAWGMPLAFHLHGCFTLLPLPGRLCFPLKHTYLTSSGQLVLSFFKLTPTIPVIFPSWDLIIT